MAQNPDKSVRTANEYRAGNIANLDDAWTRRLVASVVDTESSGGNLSADNGVGYYGRYQGGAGWLVDAGLVNREKYDAALKASGFDNDWDWGKSGGAQRFLRDASNWNNGLSLDKYLASAELQDQAFRTNSNATYQKAVEEGVLSANTPPNVVAGFLKARHLGGYDNAIEAGLGRGTAADANGTTTGKYYNDIARNNDGFDRYFVPNFHRTQTELTIDPLADGVLKHGDRGDAVARLQKALNDAGIRDAQGQPLPTTGLYGDRTRAAVRQYQEQHGLGVDGKAGENTLKSLGIYDELQRARTAPAQQPTQQQPTQQQPTQQQPTQQQPTQQQPTQQQPTQQQPTQQQPTQQQPASDPNLKANFQASEFLKQQSPQVRAYLDLVAWKEVHQSLNADGSPAGYRERNGVNGSRGLMPESAIADNGTLPRDELRYNVGRYQMKQVDVDDMRKRYDPKIDDFSPESQDRIAVAKMKYRGVMEPLANGDIRTAIQRGGQEWASLPGSPYGQVQAGYTADQAVAYYNQRLAFHQALDKGQALPTQNQGGQSADPLADGVLKKGESGEPVRRLQEALNNAGIRDAQGQPLPTTGFYGDRTEAAVRAYQQQKGLEVDGKAGNDTLTALGLKQGQQQPSQQPTQQPAQQQPAQQTPAPQSPTPQPAVRTSSWPTPGNYTINEADKPREGDGEYGSPRSSGKPHAGIDINGKVGDPIQSVGPGRVVQAGYANDTAGYTVIVQHDDGTRSRYLHLDKVQVEMGQRVGQDTQIGTMGRSGNTPSQGDTHLHFEMYDKNGQLTNPREFFHFQGEKSPVVKDIQERLNQQGFKGPDGKPLVPDSDFGSRTTFAVREFQKAHGIEATGIVDPNTLALLRNPQQQQNQQPTQQQPTQQAPTQQQPTQQQPTQQQPTQQQPTQQQPTQQQPTQQQPTQQQPTQQQPTQQQPTQQQPTQQSPAQPQTGGIPANVAASEGILQQGSTGPDVARLQTLLNNQGFRGPDGQPLPVNGNFDASTTHALKAFEKANGLEQNGIAGPKTLEALERAERTPQLSNPNHPDNALYQQAMKGLEQLPAGTFKNAQERENAAAALAFEAKVTGMGRIDHVAPAGNNAGFFAVQGGLEDPANRRVFVDRNQAVNQSVQQSTQLLQSAPTPVQPAPQQSSQDPQRQENPTRGTLVA